MNWGSGAKRLVGAARALASAFVLVLAAPIVPAQAQVAYDHGSLSSSVRNSAGNAVDAARKAEQAAVKARATEAGTRVFTFDSGERYEGDWSNDTLHGYGVLTWPNGNRHAGQYKDGVRDGPGVYYFHDGWRYEGAWANDKYNGYGVLFDDAGKADQSGAWADNNFLGTNARPIVFAPYQVSHLSGPARDAADRALAAVSRAEAAAQRARDGAAGAKVVDFGEGRSYAGEVDNLGALHGYGVLTWANGDRHAGAYSKGIRAGDGAFFFADGRRYLGDWRDDKYGGYGVLFRDNGRIEEAGAWADNNYVGEDAPAAAQAAPAKKYDISGLNKDVRTAAEAARDAVLKAEAAARRARDGEDGTKVMNMEPEGRYEGEVDASGALHGYGVLIWPNGDRHAGLYQNGVRAGPGVFYFYEGRRYEGQWTADKYGGSGVLFRADGMVDSAGRWSENELVQ